MRPSLRFSAMLTHRDSDSTCQARIDQPDRHPTSVSISAFDPDLRPTFFPLEQADAPFAADAPSLRFAEPALLLALATLRTLRARKERRVVRLPTSPQWATPESVSEAPPAKTAPQAVTARNPAMLFICGSRAYPGEGVADHHKGWIVGLAYRQSLQRPTAGG